MIVGFEWLIDAKDCDENALRDVETLRNVFARIISDLQLKTIGEGLWHKFDGEGGVTGLVLLTESHLACHTYPEHGTATFNLYCCRERPEWDWAENLKMLLGAKEVRIQRVVRGSNASSLSAVPETSRFRSEFPKVKYNEIKIRERGRLPHWEKESGIYFVTFRLEDSLPKDVIQQVRFEREQSEKTLEKLDRKLRLEEEKKLEILFSEKFDEYLDNGIGECYLKNPNIADLVENAIKYFDEKKYRLFAWCIMPNHIHVLFQVLPNHNLTEITHSWKSFTSKEANKILNRTGKFWQTESYDHLVRNEESFYRIAKYVLNNPIKAGLKYWRWVGSKNISSTKIENVLEARV